MGVLFIPVQKDSPADQDTRTKNPRAHTKFNLLITVSPSKFLTNVEIFFLHDLGYVLTNLCFE